MPTMTWLHFRLKFSVFEALLLTTSRLNPLFSTIPIDRIHDITIDLLSHSRGQQILLFENNPILEERLELGIVKSEYERVENSRSLGEENRHGANIRRDESPAVSISTELQIERHYCVRQPRDAKEEHREEDALGELELAAS